ncbi:hypothetical protein [Methylobacterium brachythecii]|uniref:Uncharacterized protein n=1 Tax=Methylobacterium brachythecii TaxID=1176177 RepID=A0A7W6AJS1_9HYPH|nr:hypothetical protein [Methylobacterium brachythecii]MBB3903958.1 hypothetical protein [Methylobacterium brachythecii]GLS42704.1 hypothetical protein GCM10007884_06890 [Methylobacterium brachythecii]
MDARSDDGVVVDFADAKHRRSASPASSRSVAFIAQDLFRGTGMMETAGHASEPIEIRLDHLCGLTDATVSRLAALAAVGTLSPASAARLALRHAEETRATGASRRSELPAVIDRTDLVVSGHPWGPFALRLGPSSSGAWIGYAASENVDRMVEICPCMRGVVCLLLGRDHRDRTTVRILKSSRWRTVLASRAALQAKGGTREILILGGLPFSGPARSLAIAEIGSALVRASNTKLLAGSAVGNATTIRRLGCTPATRDIFVFMEIAVPGLVDIGGHPGGLVA